jgi:uncharacterized protein (UPF0335 family)
MSTLSPKDIEALKESISQIEALETEKRSIQDDIKDIYTVLKAKGFDVKALRKLITRRRQDRLIIEKEDSALELYEGAVQ